MLASSDPKLLHRGVQAVARSPKLLDTLRKGSTEIAWRGMVAGTRVGIHDLGPHNTAAGVLAGIGGLPEGAPDLTHQHDDYAADRY